MGYVTIAMRLLMHGYYELCMKESKEQDSNMNVIVHCLCVSTN